MAGVYWVGSNGNTYVKADGMNGVQDWGSGGIARAKTMGYSVIADPATGRLAPEVNAGGLATGWVDPSGGYVDGGVAGSAAPQFKDTTAARNATQANIDAVDVGLNNSLAGINSEFERIMRQYAEEKELNTKAYDEQTQQNEQRRSAGTQAGLLAAAQGARGLRGVLASLKALGGTGELLANRAVAQTANADLGENDRTFDANATQLTNAYARTRQDEENRDNEARSARANQEKAARREAAQQRQSLYEKMAGLWTDAGNNAEAANFLGRSGSQARVMADNIPTQAGAYTTRASVFDPGKLASYLAGNNDMTVKAGDAGTGSPINSPLYALARKREEVL